MTNPHLSRGGVNSCRKNVIFSISSRLKGRELSAVLWGVSPQTMTNRYFSRLG